VNVSGTVLAYYTKDPGSDPRHYKNKTKQKTSVVIPIFTAVLFKLVKRWKLPKRPLTDE
jgi:hypothetical protein